jgi:hypothetical protein
MQKLTKVTQQFRGIASLLIAMLAFALLGCAHAQPDASQTKEPASKAIVAPAPAPAPASTYSPAQWQTRLIEFAETVSPEPEALAQEFGVTWDVTLRANKEAPSTPLKYLKSKSSSWKFEKGETDVVYSSVFSVNFSDETTNNSLSLLLPASRERCIDFNAMHQYFSVSPWKYVVKPNILGGQHPLNIYYEKQTESGLTRVSMQKTSGSSCLYFYAVTRYRVNQEGVRK